MQFLDLAESLYVERVSRRASNTTMWPHSAENPLVSSSSHLTPFMVHRVRPSEFIQPAEGPRIGN